MSELIGCAVETELESLNSLKALAGGTDCSQHASLHQPGRPVSLLSQAAGSSRPEILTRIRSHGALLSAGCVSDTWALGAQEEPMQSCPLTASGSLGRAADQT